MYARLRAGHLLIAAGTCKQTSSSGLGCVRHRVPMSPEKIRVIIGREYMHVYLQVLIED